MRLLGGTTIKCLSLWNRDQWRFIRHRCNWFKFGSDHSCWMLTLVGFHFWIYPPVGWRSKRHDA